MDALYPNPFRGEATLVYHLDETSRWVTIELFSLSGQKVAILADKSDAPGTYTIHLTEKGHRLLPGVYFIRMNTDSFTQTQKFQIGK
jgi:hypothetical protein